VLCPGCADRPELHDVYFPDCAVDWHDHLSDHGAYFASRAGVWFALLNEYERQRAHREEGA
jgi:hypothetical protein